MGEIGRGLEVPPAPLGRAGSDQPGLREAESAGRPRAQAVLTQQQSRAGLAMVGKPEWGGQGKTAQCDSTSSLVLLAILRRAT